MGFACKSLHCQETFGTQRGLTMHRKHCDRYKTHEALASERRKELAQIKLAKRKVALDAVRLKIRLSKVSDPISSTRTITHFDNQDAALDIPADSDVMDTSGGSEDALQLPTPALTQAGRPQRTRCLPPRYRDIPPEGPAPITPSLPAIAPGSYAIPPSTVKHTIDSLRTACNRFGLLRDYPQRPSFDPDASVLIEDLSNYPSPIPTETAQPTKSANSPPPPWPFKNMTVYLLMEWMMTGSNQKSNGEVDRLAGVITSSDFDVDDLTGFSARTASHILDKSDSQGPYTGDTWRETPIDISIPLGTKSSSGLSQTFSIPGLHYRPLLGILKSALCDVTALRFHFSPFKRIWKRPCGREERCYDELYTSDAWLEEHDKLQRQPNEPGCKFEKVILGLMLWSDSTHLANFGSASVWPLYLYFGNLSKYFRGKPGSGASHHVAYIPSVSPCHCDPSVSHCLPMLSNRFLTLYMMPSQATARKPASLRTAAVN